MEVATVWAYTAKFMDVIVLIVARLRNCSDLIRESKLFVGNKTKVLDCVVNFSDVVDAVAELKRGKNDGYAGLLLYHFINGCDELFVHISLLFSCMLVHGFAFDDVSNMLHVLMVLHKMVAIHIW